MTPFSSGAPVRISTIPFSVSCSKAARDGTASAAASTAASRAAASFRMMFMFLSLLSFQISRRS